MATHLTKQMTWETYNNAKNNMYKNIIITLKNLKCLSHQKSSQSTNNGISIPYLSLNPA